PSHPDEPLARLRTHVPDLHQHRRLAARHAQAQQLSDRKGDVAEEANAAHADVARHHRYAFDLPDGPNVERRRATHPQLTSTVSVIHYVPLFIARNAISPP